MVLGLLKDAANLGSLCCENKSYRVYFFNGS